MQNRWKIIIIFDEYYKELILDSSMREIKISTSDDATIVLDREIFSENVEIIFYKHNGLWAVECPKNYFFRECHAVERFSRKYLVDGEKLEFYDQNLDSIICHIECISLPDADIPPARDVSRRLGIQLDVMTEKGELASFWLSDNYEGRYELSKKGREADYRLLYIESNNGKQRLCCKAPASIESNGKKCNKILLEDKCLFWVEQKKNILTFYSRVVDEQSSIFHNYVVEPFARISIGKSLDNDICYQNSFVSKNHAILSQQEDGWHIYDNQSTNGVYVNGQNIKEAKLSVGDQIYIVGLFIIVGFGFISINNSNKIVKINNKIIHYVPATYDVTGLKMPPMKQEERSLFNRYPRNRIALEPKDIEIEAPPLSLNSGRIPLILRMGSSMVMGGSAMLSGHYTMMLSSVLFPILTQKYTDKEKKEYEERRNKKYQDYLWEKEAEIQNEQEYEQNILNQNYEALSEVILYPREGKRLWERQITDEDFLELRIGEGELEMKANLKYPERRFNMDEDPLEEKMYKLVKEKFMLKHAPITTSLVEEFVCGVMGSNVRKLEFVKNLVMELVLLHSYDEVKMIFLANQEYLDELEFIKFLPHIWDNQKSLRFLAVNDTDAYQIGEYLKREIEEDVEKPPKLKEILKRRPYYVIFALDKKIFDSMEILKDVLKQEDNCGVSIIAAFDNMPKECFKIFKINDTGASSVIYLKQSERQEEAFYMDYCDKFSAARSMKQLANTNLKIVTQAYALPKMITFLGMFGVGKIEYLNPWKRWQENNPVKSLATPVGVCTDGSLFQLDLHEKYQGPHGLVAGMTGSGKSEFIITYILSMAVNYHPDEVAFVLIDYKGGGLAGAFEDESRGIHLPHLAGTITNLDGSTIQRSLMSIQSELKRRQKIFNKVKSDVNEGTMDIYAYQKLYRNKRVKEPLPHLFIISDEFAELKKQEPEFMDQLISAARIGRSLGVHLILATQKPSGVVNDQILSNTKFRVCLRVQDKMDSMDMLKRPEAAELKDTGRFYLQVGYNEFFALGQSAWCGAPYEPQETVVIKKDDSIQFLDSVGQTVLQTKVKEEKKDSGMKQIVAVVKMLSDLARKEEIASHQLWQEPLPGRLSLENITAQYPEKESRDITVLLGLIDDPEYQKQYPLYFDIQNCQHLLVVGESGSGKTTLLQTMLFSIAHRYSPEEVNFYILDFSSRILNIFGKLPHCGAVLLEEDEDDVDRLFQLVSEITEERKKLFADAEVSSFEAYRKIAPLPLILVIIDNMSGLTGLKKGNSYYTGISEYMRNGSSYGIRFVMSANHMNAFITRTKQEAGTRISLQLKDKFEYGDVLGCKCNYVPPAVKGRGMVVCDERPLEFQTATLEDAANPQESMNILKKKLEVLAESYKDRKPAKKLARISETETYEEFCRGFKRERIPLGYSVKDVKTVALPLKQFFCLSLYFGNPVGVIPVMDNFLYAAHRECMEVIIVKRKKGSIFESQNGKESSQREQTKVSYIECIPEDSVTLWKRLAEEIQKRKVFRNEYCEKNGLEELESSETMERAAKYIRKHTSPLLIIFESFLDFCKNADDSCLSIFPSIFKGGKGYNFYFIGCYMPGDADALAADLMHQVFQEKNIQMLFGGQFHRQGIVGLPVEYQNVRKVSASYNKCLLQYRSRIYPLHMPCGILKKTEQDNDDEPII